MLQKNNLRLLCLTAVFAAVTAVLTYLVHFPSPLGYIHPGDAGVLLCATLLPLPYGAAAAAIASALADLLAGYAVYAPATAVIKALMVVVMFCAVRNAKGKKTRLIVGGIAAEVVMIVGYLLYETALYGFGGALAGVPFNALQGAVGVVGAVIFDGILRRALARFLQK